MNRVKSLKEEEREGRKHPRGVWRAAKKRQRPNQTHLCSWREVVLNFGKTWDLIDTKWSCLGRIEMVSTKVNKFFSLFFFPSLLCFFGLFGVFFVLFCFSCLFFVFWLTWFSKGFLVTSSGHKFNMTWGWPCTLILWITSPQWWGSRDILLL